MIKRPSSFLLAVLAAAVSLASVSTAEAGWRKNRNSNIRDGTVVAHSRHGNGSVSALVRSGRNGLQIRLPNGRWTYCRTSCSETLRVKTVDYDARPTSLVGRGTMLRECGIFGCLDIGW